MAWTWPWTFTFLSPVLGVCEYIVKVSSTFSRLLWLKRETVMCLMSQGKNSHHWLCTKTQLSHNKNVCFCFINPDRPGPDQSAPPLQGCCSELILRENDQLTKNLDCFKSPRAGHSDRLQLLWCFCLFCFFFMWRFHFLCFSVISDGCLSLQKLCMKEALFGWITHFQI